MDVERIFVTLFFYRLLRSEFKMAYRHKRRQFREDPEAQPDVVEQESPNGESPPSIPPVIEHPSVVETELSVDVPSVPEKEEVEVVEKKAKRKRKAKAESADGADGVSEAAPASKKSKKDQLLNEYMMNELPALRKEMKLQKKEQPAFKIREYGEYFKAGSKFTPTYCLRLFNFLGKNSVVCTQYGVFDKNRHMIKTDAGFNHVTFLISSLGDAINPEESEFMMHRYGKEWFKIPTKDASRVETAVRFGEGHKFKVVLTGVYEDSFFGKDGEEVFTINPILRYEAFRAPPPKVKKEKKSPEVVSEPIVDQSIAEIL